MNKLIIANLVHRPVRSIISVLAVSIEVVMILSIVAIFMGMLNDQKQRTNGIGADLVVSPSNASFMNGMSGAPMPVKLAPFLATLPHVAVASPAIHQLFHGRLRSKSSGASTTRRSTLSNRSPFSPAAPFRGLTTSSSTTSGQRTAKVIMSAR